MIIYNLFSFDASEKLLVGSFDFINLSTGGKTVLLIPKMMKKDLL